MFVVVMELADTELEDIRAASALARGVAARLDPDAVFVFDAPGLFAELDRLERYTIAAKVLLARRVEAAATWRADGFRSAAEQIACLTETSITSARRLLDTSKLLEQLPATTAALRAGLSLPKVELIAATAAVAPEAETGLLAEAHLPYPQVRDSCLRAQGKDREEAHERIKRDRHVRDYADGEGAWNLRARGPIEAGAEFRTVYDPIVEEIYKAAQAAGSQESRDAFAFDALMELVRRAGGGALVEGKVSKTAPRFMGLIRADLEALRRGAVEGDEICEIAGLGPIPVRVATELLGEAILKFVITKGVDVMNVTHLGRSVTVAQQVALWWRSPVCTNEGCTRSRWLENDHRRDWAETHHTRLDEIDPLCSHDHDLKTYRGWALVEGKGRRPMVAPDDPRHPKFRPRPPPGP